MFNILAKRRVVASCILIIVTGRAPGALAIGALTVVPRASTLLGILRVARGLREAGLLAELFSGRGGSRIGHVHKILNPISGGERSSVYHGIEPLRLSD